MNCDNNLDEISSFQLNCKQHEDKKQKLINQIGESKKQILNSEKNILNQIKVIYKIKTNNESIKVVQECKRDEPSRLQIEMIEQKLNQCNQIKAKIQNIEKQIKSIRQVI